MTDDLLRWTARSFPRLHGLQLLAGSGAVLIVRVDDAELAHDVAEAAIAGGVTALEITLSVPGALGVVERLARAHEGRDVLIGAGTVLDAQSGWAAIDAGARMLVTPHVSPEVITLAHRHHAVVIAGASTPTEIVRATEAGADLVKLFPAEFTGPDYVRTVLAPLAGTPIVPTGGVTADNVKEWFAAGVAAVGVGSAISKAGGAQRDMAAVTEAARSFLAAVRDARG